MMRSARFRANSAGQTDVSTGGSLGSRAVLPLVLACALGALSVSARTQEPRDGPAADTAVPAATVIVQVSIGHDRGLPVVRIDGNGRLTYQLVRLNNPDRLILDFPGARLAAAWPAIPSASRPVLQVRVGQYKPDVARVVIDLEQFGPYLIRPEGSSLSVTFAAAPESSPNAPAPPAGQEKNALGSPRTEMTPVVPAPQAVSPIPPTPQPQSPVPRTPAYAAPAPASSLEPSEPVLKDGLLTFRAHDQTLRFVLETIGNKLHVPVLLAQGVGEERVSVEFNRQRVDQALWRILKDYDVFLFYGSGRGKEPSSLKAVWVYPASRGQGLQPAGPEMRADPLPVSRDPKLLVVDDDHTECPQPDAVNLQQVIKLARAGDTIHVCPGTYAGGAVVDKPRLTLVAQGARGAVKIVGAGASGPKFGFTIVADGVQIEGFEISGFAGQRDASGIFVGGLFPGDMAHRANGAVIKRNNIHDNGNGIYLWRSNRNQVLENQLHHNRNHDGHGGVGVLSLAGSDAAQIAAANAARQSGTGNEISQNTVRGNDRGGIFLGACDDRQTCPGDERAVISGTEVTYNYVYENGTAGPLAGISLYSASGGAAGIQIADNQTERNHTGILLHRVDHARVERNLAAENQTGISLVASHANHLTGNEAEDNTLFDGILLRSSSDNQVVENDAIGNARDGIRAGEDSTGNTFGSNVLTNNKEHDVHDESVGQRTAGRANTWKENQCGKGSVPGLCGDEDEDQSSANLPFILTVSFLLGGLTGRAPSRCARR